MAIINCPGCKQRISNKVATCPHCGFGIGDREGGLPLQEAERRYKKEVRYGLQKQSYWALVVTAAGLGWMWLEVYLKGVADTPSIFLAAAGAVWYAATRIRMVLLKRRK